MFCNVLDLSGLKDRNPCIRRGDAERVWGLLVVGGEQEGLSRKLFAVQSQVRPHYTRGRVSGRGGGVENGLLRPCR